MVQENPRILFIDDEVNVLTSLYRNLRLKHDEWSMWFESDLEEALLTACRDRPQIVVTDLKMPGMSGIDLIKKMRQVMPSPATFLLLTGSGDLPSAIDAINQAQVFRFLTKPCSTDDLILALEKALDHHGRLYDKVKDDHIRLAGMALSLLSPAIAIVNSKAHITYMNDSAADLFKLADGLSIDPAGFCRTSSPTLSQRLSSAIEGACEKTDCPPQFLAIPRRLNPGDLTLVVIPVDGDRVALFITDPDTMNIQSPDSLIELFGLTRSESLIAHTIVNGGSLEDAAGVSNITISSARTYLKRIFSKTGVSRQSDLVQLILATPVPLIRQAS